MRYMLIMRDTEQAVVTSGLTPGETTPVTYVAGGTTTSAPFTAPAATVSPDGQMVAAAVPDQPGVTLWDPSGSEPRPLDPGPTATIEQPLGIVWTDDNRLVVWSPDSWQVVTLTGGG